MPRTVAAFPPPSHATPQQEAFVHRTFVPYGYPPPRRPIRPARGPAPSGLAPLSETFVPSKGVRSSTVPDLYISHRILAARLSPLRRHSSRDICRVAFPPAGRCAARGPARTLVDIVGSIPDATSGPIFGFPFPQIGFSLRAFFRARRLSRGAVTMWLTTSSDGPSFGV
jgi:hypothetical protein